MRTLYVHHESNLVGVLDEDEDGVFQFSYDKDWLQDSSAFPLSIALALRAESYRGKAVASFFENLIPEGEQRRQIESIANLPQGDDAAFLDRFGEDCAGALSLSHNRIYLKSKASLELLHIPFGKIEKSIHDGSPVYMALIEKGELPPFSLAGAQAKFPCVITDGQIYLPKHGEPTTHIVKLPIRSGEKLLDSVQNEYLCMTLAKMCGLVIPAVQIIGDQIPLYAIERFDRRDDGEVIHRIHTQDFCQAFGKQSKEKYERHNGPSFPDCYKLVSNFSSFKANDLIALLSWVAFNLAIGNNDTHAKNLTLNLLHGRISLAPFYDLLSTALYPQYNGAFAFTIGGVSSWDKINNSHIKEFSKKLQVSVPFILSRWKPLLVRLESSLKELQVEIEAREDLAKTLKKIEREALKRISTLRKNLEI